MVFRSAMNTQAHRPLAKFVSILMLLVSFGVVAPAMLSAQATPGEKLKLPEGFKAELLYSVPSDQGSWVSLTTDPKGRLIASDQYGLLYRITPNASGSADIETIDLGIGFAQGLLCAFDSLYVVSYGVDPKARGRNKPDSKFAAGGKKPAGLYRVKDTDNDDKYDSVELLREFVGKSEHGPHAVILSPDKKSLYICAGNATQIPNPETSRVPMVWKEDQVLTRLPDARGHAAGRLAPGGWVCKTDPDGKSFELVAMGFRNQYDIAFSPDGELFTYDADMEWDVNLPWYRPTRVCHVVSGSEFGWRHGSGKWPEYYPDTVPPVINIGPGSPTGIVFGTGAKFPAKYQRALFIADWSYGIIYSVHLSKSGDGFTATKEQFCSAPALPVTDMAVNPSDGALYFLIGGRRSQSGLYRVTYAGSESTEPANLFTQPHPDAIVRHQLESFHSPNSKPDMDLVWSQLGVSSRLTRYAARTALEHQPVESWAEKAFAETDTYKILGSTMAICRVGKPAHQASVVEALGKLNWDELDTEQRIHLLRNYGLVLCRLGEASAETKSAIHALGSNFPTGEDHVDRELGKLLVATGYGDATTKIIDLLYTPSAPEPQIAFAMMLSDATEGWNDGLYKKYFNWFLESQKGRGGNSFGGYIQNIRKHAIEGLSPEVKGSLSELLAKKAEVKDPYADLKARPLVKNWTLDELVPADDSVFENRDLENGKKMFALANCYRCHRMQGQGGIAGPDLTPAGNRFNTKDLLETIIDPNKEISDQYEATMFLLDDGTTVTGRVANLSGDRYMIQTDMIDPGNFTNVKTDQIDEMKPSKTSMMPAGLLDNLTKDEILDLVAYLKSTTK